MTVRTTTAVLVFVIASMVGSRLAAQQQAPAIGYMHPAGGQAGTSIDVVLGGYDWTPDMEVFVFAPGVELELTGPPGPVIVPEPPYWFGKKARRPPFLMPRETPARLKISSDTPPGIYRWQVANANGASATGRFVVSADNEVREQEADSNVPQVLEALPVTVSGQIRSIEQVDVYRFTAPQDGPFTLTLATAALGSPLTAAIDVSTDQGTLVAEASDTTGADLRLTMTAKAKQAYTVRVYDVDFRGNRSFVYRLALTPRPVVNVAIPAAGTRGATRDVEFIGPGIATGIDGLETLVRQITFPDDSSAWFAPRIETPHGNSEPVHLLVSDLNEQVEGSAVMGDSRRINVPAAVTGVIETRYGADHFAASGTKGDVWDIQVQADAIGSGLDVAVAVTDVEGMELKRSDDLPGTTDAGMEFVLPADGDYRLEVSDSSRQSGTRAATYRLVVQAARTGFQLRGPEHLNLPLAGSASLALNVVRTGGFTEPIELRFEGLPDGVSLPETALIPAKKNSAKITLTAAADLATRAVPIRICGTARIDGRDVTSTTDPILLAITMPPPFSLDAEGKNDVTKWPRGTTFPAPVLIEREAGFEGEIVLEMAAKQGRHRQGIRGPEFPVPPRVERILYPVFLPEWLETTRTSRMVVNGVAQVRDPAGRVRYLTSKLKTRIGFLPTGALLKINCDLREITVRGHEPIELRLTVNRASGLDEPVLVELVRDDICAGVLAAEPQTVAPGQTRVVLPITPLTAPSMVDEHQITIRATALQEGHLPVVSETQVLVVW